MKLIISFFLILLSNWASAQHSYLRPLGDQASNFDSTRDALVFYDQADNIVGTIDLCFACLHDHFSDKRYYYMKYAQLLAIKSFFKNNLGHPVDLRPY